MRTAINAKVGKRGYAHLDSRVVDNDNSFLDALQDFYSAENEFSQDEPDSQVVTKQSQASLED